MPIALYVCGISEFVKLFQQNLQKSLFAIRYKHQAILWNGTSLCDNQFTLFFLLLVVGAGREMEKEAEEEERAKAAEEGRGEGTKVITDA